MQSCRLIPAPTAPACRSRRGEAPEGSSLFRPGVEARSAEDPGKEDPEKYIRPRQGVALVRESSNQCDALAGSRSPAMPDPRVVGAAPLDPLLNDEHPYRGAFFTTLHSKWSGFCNAQMRHPWSSTPSGLESHPIGTVVLPHRDCSPTPPGLESLPTGTGVAPTRDCAACLELSI